MLKKILLSFLTAGLFTSTALADQELGLYNEYCSTLALGGVKLNAGWHNSAGDPSCAVSSSKTGSYCTGGILNDIVLTVTTKIPHGICTCDTDYKASTTIIVHPACGGTFATPLFYVYGGGCDGI